MATRRVQDLTSEMLASFPPLPEQPVDLLLQGDANAIRDFETDWTTVFDLLSRHLEFAHKHAGRIEKLLENHSQGGELPFNTLDVLNEYLQWLPSEDIWILFLNARSELINSYLNIRGLAVPTSQNILKYWCVRYEAFDFYREKSKWLCEVAPYESDDDAFIAKVVEINAFARTDLDLLHAQFNEVCLLMNGLVGELLQDRTRSDSGSLEVVETPPTPPNSPAQRAGATPRVNL